MGTILIYCFFIVGAFASIRKPWIGVSLAYFFIILNPQSIWYWHFAGLRPMVYILVPTAIGFLWAFINGNVSVNPFKNKINIFIVILWLAYCISYYFGSYVDIKSSYRFQNPHYFFGIINKSLILYFIGCFCVTTEKQLKYLTVVIVISTIYLTWWINDQYLFQGRYGRIGGPSSPSGGSIYLDENAFALLFVIGIPFLYYMGLYLKRKSLRYSMLLCIPFAWHAIFLTGSRGAILALGTSSVVIAFRSPKKKIGFLLIPMLFIAFAWQGGSLLKSRVETLGNYNEESSAVGRLQAWSAAINMIVDNPIVGVGLSSFGPAFPDYSSNKPREAHNTYFQITAESGLPAGLSYAFIILLVIKSLLPKKNDDRGEDDQFKYLLNEAILASFVGMVVVSLFLSIQFYEIFYYLCLLAYALALVRAKDKEDKLDSA